MDKGIENKKTSRTELKKRRKCIKILNRKKQTEKNERENVKH